MADNPTAISVRCATSIDSEQIAAIYNEGITGGASTFETERRTPADIVEWFAPPGSPVLVAQQRAAEIVGWARVAPYSSPPCYRGIGEASVYVIEHSRGRGIGTVLATALAAEAERAGLHKLLGKLFPENEASRRLVARLGFRAVGIHVRHGRLNGAWRDVLLVELLLGEARPVAAGELDHSAFTSHSSSRSTDYHADPRGPSR